MNGSWRVALGLLLAAAIMLPAQSASAATLTAGAPSGGTLIGSRSADGRDGRPHLPADGNGNGGNNGDSGDGGGNGNKGDGWNGWNGGSGGDDGDNAGNRCGHAVYCSGAPALGWPLLGIFFGGAVLIVIMRRRRGES